MSAPALPGSGLTSRFRILWAEDKAVRFLKKLRLHEGRFAGQKFPLQDWQERLIRKIYGPVDDLGRRQNTKAGSSPYCLTVTP